MMKKLFLTLFLFTPLLLQAGFQRPFSDATQEADLTAPCAYLYPSGQPGKVTAPNELDVRSCNLADWDFRAYSAWELADVLTFDSQTVFPKTANLPRGFDPDRILLHGTNPGLSIRRLHKKGINGRGVAVAIIDQNLLTTHEEYKDHLALYKELADYSHAPADTNATAEASVLIGRHMGVAPHAMLFHFAVEMRETRDAIDAMPFAEALQQIFELNTQLSPRMQIKVVSISVEFGPQDNGYEAFLEVRRKLERTGTAVFTANITAPLSRIHALDNADNPQRYCRPATSLDKAEYYDEYEWAGKRHLLLAPSDFRVVASPTGTEDYVQFAQGGEAWSVPYVAGLYALGLQANPKLNKWLFLKAWHETAEEKKCVYDGVTFTASNFPDPEKLIAKIQQMGEEKAEEGKDDIAAAPRPQGRPPRSAPRSLWKGKFRGARHFKK